MEDENKITSKIAMPSAAKIIKEKKLDILDIVGTGIDNRITKGDVLLYLNQIKTENGFKVKNINKEKQINVRKGSGMDVLVPVLGESVVEATVSKWIKKHKWIAWLGLLAILVVAIDLIYTDLIYFI